MSRKKCVVISDPMSMTRSFLATGASQVMVSLWPVEDEATRALMTEFYRQWTGERSDTSRALRAAQASIRKQEKWKHPTYWAAWQIWGAFR